MTRRANLASGLLMLAALLVSVFAIAPFAWMVLTSLRPPSELFTSPVKVFPSAPYWESYTRVWQDGHFGTYFLNSLFVSVAATVLSLALATLAALGFTRYTIVGGRALLLGVLLSQLFPLVLLVPPYYTAMRALGILDTLWSLVLAYISFALPFSIWMLAGYFRSIPVELEEAAQIDGSTKFGAHWRVTLPLAGPGIAATVIYCFILAWNEYLFATTFISSPSLRTLPIGLQAFIGEYQTDWNLLMAGAVVTTIPVVLLFVFLQRYLVAGLTAGAVKG